MPFNNELRIVDYRKMGAIIGQHVFMDSDIYLDKLFPDLIEIGDFVVISSGVRIFTHDDSACNTLGYLNQKGKVTIKRNAFIGAGSIILPSITIGENSIVEAGSVITRDVPPNTIVAGNPAQKIGNTPDLIEKIKSSNKIENFQWRSPYLPPEYLDVNSTKLSHNSYALFSSYINRDQIVEKYPNYLVIEPTNYCNLNCIMCPRGSMKRPLGSMDENLFKKIIDEIEGKVEFIYLHFFGEPLLNKKIFNFIQYASGKGITIGMSTNGTLLTDENSKKLLKSNLDMLIISVDSLHKETYDTIRPGGDHSQLLINIDNFLNLHKSFDYQMSISIQMIEMNTNRNEILDFKKKWDSIPGVNVTIKPLYNYANQVKDTEKIGFSCNQHKIKRKACVEPWRGFVICWDGTVVPCCNDFNLKNPIGNVAQQSIQEIWNSEEMVKMRICQRDGKQSENELCKGCLIHYEDYLTGISHFSGFNSSRRECYSYLDSGLYPLEIFPEYEALWTMKNFELLIQDKFHDVSLILCNDHPNHSKNQVKIYLFNKFVKEEIIERKTQIFLQTPHEYKGRLLRYSFHLEHDWRPADYKINNDTRKLGVKIDKIINN